ncbi:hypothetical protein AB0J83_09750 [Actinoplanes sp. NPDC049596]|uniref:hypothetical protein n=1 Tax=unclassified Actinoplanes TaxID=2626549 RepID=UPI003424FCA1
MARSARWCAAIASAFCVVTGLVLAWSDAPDRSFFLTLAAIFLVPTAFPQLFRRRTAFQAACWSAVVVLLLGELVIFFYGGCLFLPVLGPLVLAALRPPGPLRTGLGLAEVFVHRERPFEVVLRHLVLPERQASVAESGEGSGVAVEITDVAPGRTGRRLVR